jgi:hypothetical protein
MQLLTIEKGFSRDNDENVTPFIFNEFAGVAFCFGPFLGPGKQE